ncbi:MAG: hypothetical protein ACOZBH_03200 [Patescibacteria group bacterium]
MLHTNVNDLTNCSENHHYPYFSRSTDFGATWVHKGAITALSTTDCDHNFKGKLQLLVSPVSHYLVAAYSGTQTKINQGSVKPRYIITRTSTDGGDNWYPENQFVSQWDSSAIELLDLEFADNDYLVLVHGAFDATSETAHVYADVSANYGVYDYDYDSAILTSNYSSNHHATSVTGGDAQFYVDQSGNKSVKIVFSTEDDYRYSELKYTTILGWYFDDVDGHPGYTPNYVLGYTPLGGAALYNCVKDPHLTVGTENALVLSYRYDTYTDDVVGSNIYFKRIDLPRLLTNRLNNEFGSLASYNDRQFRVLRFVGNRLYGFYTDYGYRDTANDVKELRIGLTVSDPNKEDDIPGYQDNIVVRFLDDTVFSETLTGGAAVAWRYGNFSNPFPGRPVKVDMWLEYTSLEPGGGSQILENVAWNDVLLDMSSQGSISVEKLYFGGIQEGTTLLTVHIGDVDTHTSWSSDSFVFTLAF